MVALRHGGDEPNPIKCDKEIDRGIQQSPSRSSLFILAVAGIAPLMVVFDVTIVPSAASLTDELPA
jgi:hypothetical protein